MRRARSLQAKCLALPVKVRIEKFGFARFRISGQMEKQLTKSRNKRKKRISKGAHSSEQWTEIEVGKFRNSLHSELSAQGKFMEINGYSISIYKSIYLH